MGILIKYLLFILLLLPSISYGACGSGCTDCTAADAERDTVDACITNAADGATVTIPAGSATWASALSDITTKSIKLVGAGSDGTGTNITYNGTSTAILKFSNIAKTIEISGIRFSSDTKPSFAMIMISNSSKSLIHDNYFNMVGAGAVYWGQGPGVFYKNTIVTTNGNQILKPHGLYESSWSNWTSHEATDPQNYGRTGVNEIYIEGNTITVTSSTYADDMADARYGKPYVFRYNTVKGAVVGGHGQDSCESMLWKQVYNNYMTTGGFGPYGCGIQWRGGSGLSHDNVMVTESPGAAPIGHYIAYMYRSCDIYDYTDGISASCKYGNNWKYCSVQGTKGWTICSEDAHCDGTSGRGTGTCSVMFCSTHKYYKCSADSDCPDYATGELCNRYADGDGVTDDTDQEYPCFMQVGRGVNGDSHPIYQWRDQVNGSYDSIPPDGTAANCSGTYYSSVHFVENRDYFNYDATFDGTAGVGDSRDGSRPETCTVGVGWWDNGNSKFYRCTATNTWTEYFTQVACPHPDTGLSGSCDSTKQGTSGYPTGSGSGGAATIGAGGSIGLGAGGTITLQ